MTLTTDTDPFIDARFIVHRRKQMEEQRLLITASWLANRKLQDLARLSVYELAALHAAIQDVARWAIEQHTGSQP